MSYVKPGRIPMPPPTKTRPGKQSPGPSADEWYDDDKCFMCGKRSTRGGCHTNADPYNEAAVAGIEPPGWAFYCWDCVMKGWSPNFDAEITAGYRSRGLCGFLEHYVGRCTRPLGRCPDHEHVPEEGCE